MADRIIDPFYRRRHVDAAVIDDDRRCMQCGYQLRGLRAGAPCPECGRTVLQHRTHGLNEIPVAILHRLRAALLLVLLCWVAGMGLWFWSYYGLLDSAGPVLTVVLVLVGSIAIVRLTVAWNQVDEPPAALWRSLTHWMRLTFLVASILLGVLALVRGGVLKSPATDVRITLVTATGVLWIALQAMVCLLLKRIADAGHDNRLGQRFWHLAWAMGLCVAFMSPYLAVTQVIQNRSGMVPVCCLSGYLLVIGFFVAQITFGASILRLRAIVRWAIRYRHQYERKTKEMIERIEGARQAGDAESTAFLRD